MADIEHALDRMSASPPVSVGGAKVLAVRDYRRGADVRPRWLGASMLIELELEGGRVLVRPSGTEPKLKIYVDLRGEAAQNASIAAVEEELAGRALSFAREVVEILGISREDRRS
jgi:phosphomannomutase